MSKKDKNEEVVVKAKSYFQNKFGIKIVKCCASCQHKEFDKGCVRICKKNGILVKSSDLCDAWNIRAELDNVGIGGGRVKKKNYLEFLSTHPYRGTSELNALRLEFESKYGSIYNNR